jgi:hypothetical protein
MGAKKNSDAIAYLTTIVEEYPTSEEISVAKTLLGQAEAIK